MKHTLLFFAFFLSHSGLLFSQATCSNPLQVELCPSVMLTGQTNAGMGDDAPSACNVPGEDVVYELHAPNGAEEIFISVTNASSSLTLSMEQQTCNGALCDSRMVSPGNSSLSFRVNSTNFYYIWVDAAATVTYTIAFGGDTGSVFVSIPNTQGNLQLEGSGCTAHRFAVNKPFLQVTYNSAFQAMPMTLAPLFVPGVMCITTYFKNTTGIEGIRIFSFNFNSAGYASVTPVQAAIPGSYNSGNWLVSGTGGNLTYKFVDDAGLGKGDFGTTPNTCLAYTFCFNLVPLSNDPALTDVDVEALSDGFGVGFSGIVRGGCCPSSYANCINTGGGSPASATHGFAFGFDDPGALPVSLLSFEARPSGNKVIIRWSTASETNNDYFTIEKSVNLSDWTIVSKVKGAGNASTLSSYETTDDHPFPGISYYRLRQTDFDGSSWISTAIAVEFVKKKNIDVYPNPAWGFLTVNIQEGRQVSYQLLNAVGESVSVPVSVFAEKSELIVSAFHPGIYFLIIREADDIIYKEKIAIAE